MARRKLAGLRVLVTGASQGIGRALVRRGARSAARRCWPRPGRRRCSTNSPPRSQEPTASSQTVAADVTKPEDRQAMVDAATQHFGGLDVLVNNAGIGATGPLHGLRTRDPAQIFETNFFGLTETTRVFLPLLKQGVTPAIVNISSVVGKRAMPARSLYSSSKFAVAGLQRGDPRRTGEGRHRRDRRQPRPDADELLEEHARAEGEAADGPPARHDQRRGRGRDAAARSSKGSTDVTLTLKGKMLVLVNRFVPWFVDCNAKKKVRELFADEIAERKRNRDQQSATQIPK